MHTPKTQTSGAPPQTASHTPQQPPTRPFEVTYPGQEVASSPTNPFPSRPHEVWMGEPRVARQLAPNQATDGNTASEPPGFELDWNRISLYATGQTPPEPPKWQNMQAKLAITPSNYRNGQDANHVAASVMAIPLPTSPIVQRQTEEGEAAIQSQSLTDPITPLVQRDTALTDEGPIQAKCESRGQDATVQRSADGIEPVQPDLESRLNASKGGGRPLPEAVRSFMEPRFQADFSQVSVHTGSEAIQMNQELNTHAFTHQQDIYFGAGNLPGKDPLTAHELTHIVQQNSEKVQPKSQVTSISETVRQPAVGRQKTFQAIAGAADQISKSPVLDYLQSLTKKTGHHSSIYRSEISNFQQTNPSDQIRSSQNNFLEKHKTVEVVERDHSQTLRGCLKGCSPEVKHSTRDAAEKSKPTVDPTGAIQKAAASLVVIGGTANDGDKNLVIAELIKMPLPALNALKTKGTKVVVCHNSVTEIRTDLKGVRPRGWPVGKTWDTVPGLYDPGGNRVIIAIRGGRVPPTGDGHGAYNLVLHEVGHAVGDALGTGSGGENDPKFIAAREQDKARLSPYENQPGAAGVQETYAESFARFYGKDPNDATLYPHIHAYWASNPFISASK